MEVLDAETCPQGSEQWFKAHMGLPTASEFFKVMAKVGPKGGTTHKEYIQRTQYMRMLAGEILTGEATRVSNDERKGIASAFGSSGSYMSCEYQMNNPRQGAGTCTFSNGARYKLHVGG